MKEPSGSQSSSAYSSLGPPVTLVAVGLGSFVQSIPVGDTAGAASRCCMVRASCLRVDPTASPVSPSSASSTISRVASLTGSSLAELVDSRPSINDVRPSRPQGRRRRRLQWIELRCGEGRGARALGQARSNASRGRQARRRQRIATRHPCGTISFSVSTRMPEISELMPVTLPPDRARLATNKLRLVFGTSRYAQAAESAHDLADANLIRQQTTWGD